MYSHIEINSVSKITLKLKSDHPMLNGILADFAASVIPWWAQHVPPENENFGFRLSNGAAGPRNPLTRRNLELHRSLSTKHGNINISGYALTGSHATDRTYICNFSLLEYRRHSSFARRTATGTPGLCPAESQQSSQRVLGWNIRLCCENVRRSLHTDSRTRAHSYYFQWNSLRRFRILWTGIGCTCRLKGMHRLQFHTVWPKRMSDHDLGLLLSRRTRRLFDLCFGRWQILWFVREVRICGNHYL